MPPKGWKKNAQPVAETATAVAEMPAVEKPKTRKPRVSVLERRLQNPFGEPSAPVRLKTPGLIARWFNSAIRPDAFWRARELGWEGVTPDMIVDLQQIGFYTKSMDGYVARGERGQEVLMYMPEDDYKQIQAAKTAKNLKDMKDYDAEKHRALNAFAESGGDADFMANKIQPVGGVRTSYERVQQVPETE